MFGVSHLLNELHEIGKVIHARRDLKVKPVEASDLLDQALVSHGTLISWISSP